MIDYIWLSTFISGSEPKPNWVNRPMVQYRSRPICKNQSCKSCFVQSKSCGSSYFHGSLLHPFPRFINFKQFPLGGRPPPFLCYPNPFYRPTFFSEKNVNPNPLIISKNLKLNLYKMWTSKLCFIILNNNNSSQHKANGALVHSNSSLIQVLMYIITDSLRWQIKSPYIHGRQITTMPIGLHNGRRKTWFLF